MEVMLAPLSSDPVRCNGSLPETSTASPTPCPHWATFAPERPARYARALFQIRLMLASYLPQVPEKRLLDRCRRHRMGILVAFA